MTADARLVVLERVVGDGRATDAHMRARGEHRGLRGILGDAGFVTLSWMETR